MACPAVTRHGVVFFRPAVLDGSVTVKTSGVFNVHVALVHLFLIARLFEESVLVVAAQAVFFLDPAGAQNHHRLDRPSLEGEFHFFFTGTPDEIEMAAAAGDTGFF